MKEVTHEKWMENPTPRMMWVWNFEEEKRQKLKVIYVSVEDAPYPVITIATHGTVVEKFLHCAEIEESRRMTNRELSRWLREKPTREYKFKNSDSVYCDKNYREIEKNDEVSNDIFIREDYGEWREPLTEE